MTGKELVLNTFNGKETPRTPWIPFAGIHAGRLAGYNAIEVLKDSEKLLKAIEEVHKLYTPDGQPVVFDLQLEAEVLGCELQWEEFSPPSVKSHPLAETNKIPCLCKIPKKEDGRIPIVLDAMKKMSLKYGDNTALFGLICGPFTLASHLRGSNIFMDMFDDEDYVKELLKFCTEVAKAMSEYYIEAGMHVIGAVDPLVSQISPEHFEEFLSEPFSELFDFIKKQDAHSSFFVCGNAANNIEVMCQTKPDAIFVDENVNLARAKEITDRYKITVGGNIPLTTIMLHGNQQDNMKYVIDLLDQLDKHHLIIAPGCDMPYHVPVENTVAVAQAVRRPDEVRDMVKNYEANENLGEVVLPDYDSLERPFIEVFTLDSSSCAACTYMMDAAKNAKEHFGDKIDIIEYKITEKENIARVKKMKVKQLPSIYINGQLKYSSIIPNRKELELEVNKAMNKE